MSEKQVVAVASTQQNVNQALDIFLVSGSLTALDTTQKAELIKQACTHYGLQPILHPFDVIQSNGGHKLYLNSVGLNQLASIYKLQRTVGELVIDKEALVASLTVEVTDGVRTETEIAMVSIGKWEKDPKTGAPALSMMKGEDYCNAIMKLYTKAKRRATYSIVGFPQDDGYEDSGYRARAVDTTVVQGAIEGAVQQPLQIQASPIAAVVAKNRPQEVEVVARVEGEEDDVAEVEVIEKEPAKRTRKKATPAAKAPAAPVEKEKVIPDAEVVVTPPVTVCAQPKQVATAQEPAPLAAPAVEQPGQSGEVVDRTNPAHKSACTDVFDTLTNKAWRDQSSELYKTCVAAYHAAPEKGITVEGFEAYIKALNIV